MWLVGVGTGWLLNGSRVFLPLDDGRHLWQNVPSLSARSRRRGCSGRSPSRCCWPALNRLNGKGPTTRATEAVLTGARPSDVSEKGRRRVERHATEPAAPAPLRPSERLCACRTGEQRAAQPGANSPIRHHRLDLDLRSHVRTGSTPTRRRLSSPGTRVRSGTS